MHISQTIFNTLAKAEVELYGSASLCGNEIKHVHRPQKAHTPTAQTEHSVE